MLIEANTLPLSQTANHLSYKRNATLMLYEGLWVFCDSAILRRLVSSTTIVVANPSSFCRSCDHSFTCSPNSFSKVVRVNSALYCAVYQDRLQRLLMSYCRKVACWLLLNFREIIDNFAIKNTKVFLLAYRLIRILWSSYITCWWTFFVK